MKQQYVVIAALVLPLLGCSTYSATEPFHHPDGEDMVISGVMPNGYLKIYINGTVVIENSILHFGEPFSGKYANHAVTAVCRHRKNLFSVENECDVFIDNKPGVNLVLR